MTAARLREGDYCPDGAGAFQEVQGAEALLERVLFKLQARRGAFPLLPDLGSRLHDLPRVKASARSALGAAYAAEALAGEEVTVTGAVWTEDTQTLTVYLAWQGEDLTVDVTV